MRIRRTSPFSGKVHDMEIDVTPEQLYDWQHGALIQNAMPNLTPVERDFIKTGITPQEWEQTFGHEPQ